ncbi:MAG TPA: hypothetical protein VIC32_06910 [Terriglobales bacterium]|jgi:hypothetical protein
MRSLFFSFRFTCTPNAQEDGFAERLAEFMPQFEVYLQFDSLRREPLKRLRGAELRLAGRSALEVWLGGDQVAVL